MWKKRRIFRLRSSSEKNFIPFCFHFSIPSLHRINLNSGLWLSFSLHPTQRKKVLTQFLCQKATTEMWTTVSLERRHTLVSLDIFTALCFFFWRHNKFLEKTTFYNRAPECSNTQLFCKNLESDFSTKLRLHVQKVQ